ncbi:MAG: hypothetical protein ABSA97_08875 [Verrucomicrobiia bacterium]
MKTLAPLLTLIFVLPVSAADKPVEPLRIIAPELAKLDFKRTDGALAPASGLRTFVVFRADKERPELSDWYGWTYHHHPDLACWKGRLYVGWSSCERDEDTGVSHELFRTSTDGEDWSTVAALFPPGVSTPLRMYFFRAPNGRMLAIAGLRTNREKTSERTKGPLVVREIRRDHTLGAVFTLRPPASAVEGQPPDFNTSVDEGFVEACRQLLANRLFLEQQDYGNLLAPEERMKWHDTAAWDGDDKLKKDATGFGKAMCFFRRADGALVAVAKMGWVTLSRDDGRTWDQPVRPHSLVTGMGKVWGQHLRADRYVLVYDPDKKLRYPLVLLTSDDGITFRNPCVIHGELPALRYAGQAKDPGASYVRGLSLWSNDGSRPDNALWLVFSVNKEEIWVSRVPQLQR